MNKLFLVCGLALVAAGITSCQSDDEPLMPQQGQDEALTRSTRDQSYVITFEDGSPRTLAGPTSYGANLYSGSYPTYYYTFAGLDRFSCGINRIGTSAAIFYNGGIVLSQWNYRSNPNNTANITLPSDGKMPSDWWYTYNNQCSVYNTASTDGANKEAGVNKSNTFAVLYGYQDSYNSSYMAKPYFSFASPKSVSSLYICNTSYVYGVVMNGNKWYNDKGELSGETKPLTENGWFKVIATGYDRNGKIVKTVEKYLCDYRTTTNPKIPMKTTWEQWYLEMDGVVKVEFNFQGSDTGTYGLNTPAYLCIDNITVH